MKKQGSTKQEAGTFKKFQKPAGNWDNHPSRQPSFQSQDTSVLAHSFGKETRGRELRQTPEVTDKTLAFTYTGQTFSCLP